VPESVGGVQSVQFGQRNGLNDREALGRAIFQIAVCLLAVEPVKQLPRGVPQPEEGFTGFRHQETSILADLQSGQRGGVAVESHTTQHQPNQGQCQGSPGLH
jgi:hypothetical protein